MITDSCCVWRSGGYRDCLYLCLSGSAGLLASLPPHVDGAGGDAGTESCAQPWHGHAHALATFKVVLCMSSIFSINIRLQGRQRYRYK